MRRSSALLLVLALAAVACSDDDADSSKPATTTTAPASAVAELVPSVCPFDPPPTDHWECSTLIVPADRDDPNGPHVLLPVAVLRSQSASKVDDPIVYFAGGPGDDTLTDVAGFFGEQERGGSRDVIIFDQRGTGGARPSLNCPELEQAQRDNLAASDDRDLERDDAAVRACRSRLADRGVDLDDFDTPTTAQDAEDLRRALGVERWNVVGVSYGTTVALEVARQHPETVRSIVVDSVFPPDVTQEGVRVLAAADRAFDVLWTGCAASSVCAASHPDLHAEFNALAASWDERPFELDVDDPRGGDQKLPIRLTGTDLVQGLQQALYRADLIPILPSVSAQIRTRDDTAQALVATFVVDALTQSLHTAEGVGDVVNCADRQRVRPPDIDVDTIVAKTPSSAVFAAFDGNCDMWDVASVPADFNTVPRSTIPMLALAGEYDPITPPSDTERVAKLFADSTYVLFPGMGHGEIFSHDCPRAIWHAFTDDPTSPPDASCVDGMGPPGFAAG